MQPKAMTYNVGNELDVIIKMESKLPDELEGLARQLLDRQSESRSLDYKSATSFGPSKAGQGELLKDIMALSNTRDGGYLVIGVEQEAGRFVHKGVSDEQAASFDPTRIGTFAKNYCSALPSVTSRLVRLDGVDLLLLEIEEFGDEPIVCTKDMHDAAGKNHVLRAGSIYVRTLDARSVAIDSGESMRALLDLAVQKRGDALLGQIQRLVGAPQVIEGGGLPAAYNDEIAAATKLFEQEKLTGAYWYFEILPITYEENRITSNARLREVRRESVVSVRGWDFPHIDREHDQAFESGIESITHGSRHNEAHRVYRSGLLTWRQEVGEDSIEEYKGALSYESAIYTITEFLILANRYAGLIADQGNFSVKLGVTGLSKRVLRSSPRVLISDYATAAERFEYEITVGVEELRASHLEFAAEATQRLFELFDFDVQIDVIKDWQKRFIERRFFG